jgi:hypothetical protein
MYLRVFRGYGTDRNKDFQKFLNILQIPSLGRKKAILFLEALGVMTRIRARFEGGSQSEKI